MHWDVLKCDGCVTYLSPRCTPGGGLSHLSDSSSYPPDTLEANEKKDESPRLSFFLSAVGL